MASHWLVFECARGMHPPWILLALIVITFPVLQTARADSPSFCAAYVREGDDGPDLTLFPVAGQKVTVPLLGIGFRFIAYSPDGTAIYGQKTDRRSGPSDAVIKVEFKPTRFNVVRGSEGLGTIWRLSLSKDSARRFASGWFKRDGAVCSVFQIDPVTGTFRTFRVGIRSDCGGDVSPDGKRMLGNQDNRLFLFDLETDSGRALGAHLRSGVWSPDGRWIAATSDADRIVLIDASDTSRQRSLGSSNGSPIFWSPDSRYLLLLKPSLRCTPTLYFESLQILEVRNGKRSVIRSSRCEVSGGYAGWMDLGAVR
jgi:hypothetical protein